MGNKHIVLDEDTAKFFNETKELFFKVRGRQKYFKNENIVSVALMYLNRELKTEGEQNGTNGSGADIKQDVVTQESMRIGDSEGAEKNNNS